MTINVGILGFAHGHVGSYCTQWTQNPGFEMNVVAGWDHDPQRLAKRAEAFGVQPYASLEACLAHPNLQAVVI